MKKIFRLSINDKTCLVSVFCALLSLPPFGGGWGGAAFAQSYLWAKSAGGTSLDQSYSVTTDAGGNIIYTGYFQGTADFDPSASIFNLTSTGIGDIFISKLDASGNFVWVKAMGGIGSDIGYSIATDVSGNIYATGYFQGTVDFDPGAGVFNLTSAGSTTDIFISKLDASGNFVWAKAIGGTDNELGYSIALDASDNVYTTGYFQGTVDFDPGVGIFNLTSILLKNIFISKLDASGKFIWAKAMGGTGDDWGISIALDASDNVYTTGYFEGIADFDPSAGVFNLTSNPDAVFVSKLDATGNFIWAKKISASNGESIYSIATDASGNVYTTGTFYGTLFDLTSVSTQDMFISKFDASGNLVWAKAIGGAGGFITGYSIVTDTSGNIYTNGYFESNSSGTFDFDPGIGEFILTSPLNNNIFISKLDSSGNFVWAKAMGGGGDDRGYSITTDASGNILITGGFKSSSITFGTTTLTNASANTFDIFIVELSSVTGIENMEHINNLTLYPNPTTGALTIENNTGVEIEKIEIYNVLGQKVYEEQPNAVAKTFTIKTNSLATGIYTLQIKTSKGVINKQVAVEKSDKQ